MLHSVKRHPDQDELTKSTLLDLFGYECERTEKLDDYLHENVCQGGRRRDPNIYTKSAEEVLERPKHNDKSVVAGTGVFDRLRDLYVTEIFRLRYEKRTYGKEDGDSSEYCICGREWL